MERRSIHTRERASDALARCGPDDLTRARASRDRLLASARVLAALLDHEPERAVGRDPADEWCGLVRRLATVEVGNEPSTGTSHGPVRLEVATRRFEAALADAVEAVRRCRQTEHGTGRCWFTSLPYVDGCAEVLRAAHRLG